MYYFIKLEKREIEKNLFYLLTLYYEPSNCLTKIYLPCNENSKKLEDYERFDDFIDEVIPKITNDGKIKLGINFK